VFSRRTQWSLAPNRFTAALEKHRASGRELLDLTASNPTNIGLRYDEARLLGALANLEALRYRPEPKGLRSAREQVAAYYRERGEQVDAEHIILTTSTSEAYSFVFRLLADPGDEVLIPSPSYPLFDFLADLQDVRLRPYTLFYDHGWHVDVHSVRTAITPRTKAIMAVHANNPTGSYLKAGEIQQISAICGLEGGNPHLPKEGRWGAPSLALVVDEVFLDFAHDGQPRASFVSNHAALTFTLSGLSKISGLPQMKFAWIVVSGPDEQAAAAVERLELIADTYLSMNAPVQLAAPALFAERHAIQRQLMARIGANLAELDRQLARQSFCQRLEIEGGWYALLRVPITRSDEELAVALLERHSVLVHPGHFFDFASDGYLVVSLITPEEEFREGVKRLLAFISNS
jgi:alanine-synthesizing transaminase